MPKEKLIYNGETLEDLQYNNLYILQKSTGFRFGMDPIILSNFVFVRDNYNVLDIGTGSAIIPILISQKAKNLRIHGIEVQSDIADMAKRSIEYNSLEDIISIYNDDVCNINSYLQNNSMDLIVTNPPYSKVNSAILPNCENKLISRHEQNLTLDKIANIASKLLKHNGKFVFCFPCNRLIESILILKSQNLEPKRLRFVHSYIDKNPYLFLMEASKQGKPYLNILPPLICNDNFGNMSNELKSIYHFK